MIIPPKCIAESRGAQEGWGGGRGWRGWVEGHKMSGMEGGREFALQTLVITICIAIALSIFLSQSCVNCRHCTLFKQ